jgi:hypothetical protein
VSLPRLERGFRRYTMEDHYEKRWIICGPSGAVDFHVSHAWVALDFPCSGGIETHYRQPPAYMKDDDPSHDHCWILGGKCWHDGSSLYASEVLIPILERDGEFGVWAQLEREYMHRLAVVEEAHP